MIVLRPAPSSVDASDGSEGETDWETNPRYRDGAELTRLCSSMPRPAFTFSKDWDKLKKRNAELILESLERSSSWDEFEALQIIQAVESGCRSDDSAEARIEDGYMYKLLEPWFTLDNISQDPEERGWTFLMIMQIDGCSAALGDWEKRQIFLSEVPEGIRKIASSAQHLPQIDRVPNDPEADLLQGEGAEQQ
ncbi:hypothetical protein OESDEN_20822 [Oesophagostomum dentatum]|uniref:Uncharacterized protein n=1 Tax=Oesophagostomum dentatum TaxID=61180 RepID=A0A0B1S3N2_OESDE|nr:hypothetical protein OESDEN_20822 [Oesophagostomum dentatum]